MAKENISNPVVDVLKKLKEDELELTSKLKPVQEAIAALEKIVEKSVKKVKPATGKDDNGDTRVEEAVAETAEASS